MYRRSAWQGPCECQQNRSKMPGVGVTHPHPGLSLEGEGGSALRAEGYELGDERVPRAMNVKGAAPCTVALLPIAPIPWTAAVMCNCQNLDLFARYRINKRVRKVSHEVTTLAAPPLLSYAGVLQQHVGGPLELGKQSL